MIDPRIADEANISSLNATELERGIGTTEERTEAGAANEEGASVLVSELTSSVEPGQGEVMVGVLLNAPNAQTVIHIRLEPGSKAELIGPMPFQVSPFNIQKVLFSKKLVWNPVEGTFEWADRFQPERRAELLNDEEVKAAFKDNRVWTIGEVAGKVWRFVCREFQTNWIAFFNYEGLKEHPRVGDDGKALINGIIRRLLSKICGPSFNFDGFAAGNRDQIGILKGGMHQFLDRKNKWSPMRHCMAHDLALEREKLPPWAEGDMFDDLEKYFALVAFEEGGAGDHY